MILALMLSVGAAAALAQEPFVPLSTLTVQSIAGRTVEKDSRGKLLPWPVAADTGYSYSSYFLSQWAVVQDQFERDRLLYYFCCFDFDRTSYELYPDQHWANSTAYLRAMMTGFVERLYPYTGDTRTLEMLQNFVDYELENGLTPEGYVWSQVPYPSANPGAVRYTGWSQHAEDYVEPPIVGEDGYAYLRLYEMTGNTKYLRAAIRCAEALVKNFKAGNEKESPWPNRCHARDGSLDGSPALTAYSANVVEPIMLFDELIRLGQGDTANYSRVRKGAWDWLMKYPMQNNVWVGYFEDVPATMENMNQVIPLELARYVLLHPELDPEWQKHALDLIDWVRTTPRWPKYEVDGALVTTEQGNGKTFCCNEPNQCCDSHSARLAAVEAFYAERTGDAAMKEAAYRTFNWVTYFQGLPGGAHAPFGINQWWFTDEFADGPRRMMDAFWAVPEWAPVDESHLLGSLSPVTRIAYDEGSVTYATFDPASTDVLRLDFAPDAVTADGKPLVRRSDLNADGYVLDEKTRVLRIRHSSAREIDIQGKGGHKPAQLIGFDSPHRAAGSRLFGEYPTGIVNWGAEVWKIAAPGGKFGTFHLALEEKDAKQSEFKFAAPMLFMGIDIANDGDVEATVAVRSPENHEVNIAVKPHTVVRLRTEWQDVSTRVQFTFSGSQELSFDNLAYRRP